MARVTQHRITQNTRPTAFRSAALVLILCLSAAPSGAREKTEHATPGQAVYERVEPLVFKVKTAITAESPKASYGTGFAVAKEGLLITNYHVVSDAVINPRLNKIFLVLDSGSIPARILGVDVLHDLALIKVEHEFPQWLKFATAKPRQGEPIYSIGEPEDLNMAIVVGTYNGELKYGTYAMIHMSSPINSGMSGGPTVNNRAQIVGVNVAKNALSDSLSFAVPARFAETLLDFAAKREAPSNEQLISEMGQQLIAVQNELTEDFLKAAEKPHALGVWQFGQPSPKLKCWSQRDEDAENDRFDETQQSCQLPHASYIEARLESGTYSLELNAIDGRSLSSAPFYGLLNSRFGASRFDNRISMTESGPKLLTRQFCYSNIVANGSGLKFKLAYCGRGYVKFKELQDISISLATIEPPPHALTLQLELHGFAPENAKKILRQTLNSIRITHR